MKFNLIFIGIILSLLLGCTQEVVTTPEQIIDNSPEKVELENPEPESEIKNVQEKVFPVEIKNLRYSKSRSKLEFTIDNKGNSPVVLSTLSANEKNLKITKNSDLLAKIIEVSAKTSEAMKADFDENCVKKENSPLGAPHITPTLVFTFEFEGKTEVVTINTDLDCT